ACLPWSESRSDGWLSPFLLGYARVAPAAQSRSPISPDPAAIAGWPPSPSHNPLPFGGRIQGRYPAAVADRPRVTSRRRDSETHLRPLFRQLCYPLLFR